MKRLLVVAVLALGCRPDTPAAPLEISASVEQSHAPLVIVQVVGDPQAFADSYGIKPAFVYRSALNGFAARVPEIARAKLMKDVRVRSIEDDKPVSIATTQANPPNWGLDRIDQAALPLNQSYTYSATGSGVNAYIIDSGVRCSHVEISGRCSTDYDAINDGMGACNWHGTHIAALVGGTSVGVAKAVSLHSVRVLDCSGNGTDAQVIAGVDWVTANASFPAVANMSISGTLSSSVNTAVANSIAAGISYVVASGNNSLDACNYTPGAVAAALTISATSPTDVWYQGSNYGKCVDVNAPGLSIYSATNTSDSAYTTANGTSQATAHVSGAVAMYLETHTTATPAQVATAIVSGATSGALSNISHKTPNLLLRSF